MAVEQAAAPVVGREEELLVLESFLDGVEGGPAALLLEGEAGSGKTTLWKQAVAAAHERGMRVLACRPGGAEAQLSFAGLDDVLSVLLEDPAGVAPDQRTIAVAFLGVLRHLALDAHVLLALDDVQWLDPASAAVLEFAIRRLRDEPIGLLLAKRIESSGPVTLALEKAVPEERLSRLFVGPLSLGALQQLLRARLGLSLPRPTLRRVQEVSAGNPFFALELARALQRRGAALAPGDDLPVPGNLKELVRERLDRLPRASREAVLAVAALAQPTEAQVEAALGAAAAQSLADAAAAGIIEFERDRICFTHPLLASVVSSEASRRERAAVHKDLAGVVDDPEERARHLALAADGPDPDVAAALDDAARAAAARGATAAAASLAELAAELTPPAAVEARQRRLLELVRYLNAAGAWSRSESLLRELVPQLPHGVRRCEALCLLAWVSEGDSAESESLLDEVIETAGDAVALRANAHLLRATFRRMRGNGHGARADAHAAADLARGAGDAALRASALGTALFQDALAGVRVGPERLSEALEAEAQAGSLPMHQAATLAVGMYLMYRDRLDEARETLELYRGRAIEEGSEYHHALASSIAAELECRAARFSVARAHAQAAVDLVAVGGGQMRNRALSTRALASTYLGHVDSARRDAEEGAELARAIGDEAVNARNVCALGFLELSLGDFAAADEHLRPLWDRLAATGLGEPSAIPILPNAIEALIGVGELGEAERQLEQLEERGRALDSAWALAQAARCRGLLAGAQGRLEEALEHFERALVEHERLPSEFERARTLLALGATQRRAKQRRTARETIQTALTIFEGLGSALWAEKAHGELGRIAGRAPSSGELTPTERRVAALAAEGRTNREVAAALYVSERTIEGNLSRVYSKLGVRSRTELAHLLAESAAPAAEVRHVTDGRG